MSKAYYCQHVALIVLQWHIAEFLWSQYQADTAKLGGYSGSLTLIGRFLQALDRKTQLNPKQINDLALHLILDRFSLFNCCLSVVSYLDKGDYPENLLCVFVLINSVPAFEHFMCWDLGW